MTKQDSKASAIRTDSEFPAKKMKMTINKQKQLKLLASGTVVQSNESKIQLLRFDANSIQFSVCFSFKSLPVNRELRSCWI